MTWKSDLMCSNIIIGWQLTRNFFEVWVWDINPTSGIQHLVKICQVRQTCIINSQYMNCYHSIGPWITCDPSVCFTENIINLLSNHKSKCCVLIVSREKVMSFHLMKCVNYKKRFEILMGKTSLGRQIKFKADWTYVEEMIFVKSARMHI